MAAKKKKPRGGNKPRGHYCKICGEHKANEKFSGKGHAAHICNACMKLAPAERSEMETLGRIGGMAFRHLSESEIKWLRNRMNDSRPAVREAAREAHSMKFPRYERNMAKKGMTAFSLELYIHDVIWDIYGDEAQVNIRVFAEDDGIIRCVDYNAPEAEREREIDIGKQEARRFLKSVVHELNAPFWNEDLSDSVYEHDPYLDILPEHRPSGPDYDEDMDDLDGGEEAVPKPSTENREPLWSLRLELNTGENKEIVFYNQMHDAPVELFWSLMERFEPEDGEDFDGNIDEDGGAPCE